MKTSLFVDGYNIIGAWPELERLKDVDLETARKILADQLSEFQALSHYEIFLIFDGHLVKNNLGEVIKTPYLTIIYTKEGMTADMLIERYVAKQPRYHKTYVATNDRLEQETILANGALRISARELKNLMEEALKNMKENVGHHENTYRQPKSNTVDAHLSPDIIDKLKRLLD